MDKEYSVLLSVYYKEKAEYLKQSIMSMLSQTIEPSDFVIVCDGELGEELNKVIDDYLKEYNSLFQIVRIDKCQGLGNALNKGLNYCKYNIVARMDSDDISRSTRMEKQLEVMKINGVDMVSATVEEFDGDIDNITAVRKLPHTHEEITKFARSRNPFNHPCMTFKKDAVLKAGGYKEFLLFEDYYLWVRMLMSGAKAYNVEEPLLYMRSGESMYERRGGLLYAKRAVRFKRELLRIGFYSKWDYVKSAGTHVIVSIMPNKLRKLFYKKILRK